MISRYLPLMASFCLALSPLSCADCQGGKDPKEEKKLPPGAIEPDIYCPGSAGCEKSSDQKLFVGASKRDVTPRGYEIAKIEFLTDRHRQHCLPEMEQIFGLRRCGDLHMNFRRNCGNDQICPDNIGPNLETGDEASDGIDNDNDGLIDGDDVEYSAPDADGSEGDTFPDGTPKLDFFHDCGLDRLCPDNQPETGAQASDGIDNDADGAIDGEDVAYPGADEGEGDGIFQGLWIAGYGNNRPALGVHDPLWVRAMVFKSGNTTVAILSLDVVGFFFSEVQRLRSQVAERLGSSSADVDFILLSSTHTHEAPDTMGQWGEADPAVSEDISDLPGRLPGYNAFIVEQAADAIIEAVNGLQPATLEIAESATGVEGFIRDGEDPQIFDDRMLVVRAAASDDSTIATIVHWAQHPESLDDTNNFVSSDFADSLRRTVEEGLAAGPGGPAYAGLGGICIYLQGMVGGLMGPNKFDFTGYDGTEYTHRDNSGQTNVKTFARTNAYGQNVAAVALAALPNAETVTEGAITVKAKSFKVPVDNVLFHFAIFRELFDRTVHDWDDTEPIDANNRPHLLTEVSLIDIGPISFLTVPGEGFPELAIGGYDGSHTPGGLSEINHPNNPNPPDVSKAPEGPYLLDLATGKYAYMIGLANDEIGYLVPPWRFELSDSPWLEDAPGDHYCETNSVGIEAAPLVEKYLTGLSLFPIP